MSLPDRAFRLRNKIIFYKHHHTYIHVCRSSSRIHIRMYLCEFSISLYVLSEGEHPWDERYTYIIGGKEACAGRQERKKLESKGSVLFMLLCCWCVGKKWKFSF